VRRVLGKVKRRLQAMAGKPAPAPVKAGQAGSGGPGPGKGQRPTTSKFDALPGDRLVPSPVFILSSLRSGSTLLRVMMNTHSQILAPHELHLGALEVVINGKHVVRAMDELSLDVPQLEHLLWDRVMHRELTRQDKTIFVSKTPGDVFRWRRFLRCWPEARFIHLLRHPAAIADSWIRARPDLGADVAVQDVLRYMVAVEAARTEHGGLTVRYEDITADPERETRRICDYLGVEWEPAMVDYGQGEHGTFERGIGDWSERIKSGKVQAITTLPKPDEIPPSLIDISVQWGYLDEADARRLGAAVDTGGVS
jgi:hypothetical protein